MVENENGNLNPEAEAQQEWQLLSEMDELGYWVGSTYNGTHRQRIELNVRRFESLCRTLDLPFVRIHSSTWNPPAETEPEMVGLGMMAWKKITTPARGEDHVNAPFELSKTWNGIEVTMNYDGDAMKTIVPYGWNLGIRDRMFERNFNRNRSQPDKKLEEAYFIDQFNKALYNGLLAIAVKEQADERSHRYVHTDEDGKRRLAACGAEAIAGLALHGTVIALTKSPLEALSAAVAGTSVTGVIAGYTVVDKQKHEVDDLRASGSFGMMATNSLRQELYPERYAKEKHGIGAIDKALVHALPVVGIAYEKHVLHYVYRYIQELQGEGSLVRLRDK